MLRFTAKPLLVHRGSIPSILRETNAPAVDPTPETPAIVPPSLIACAIPLSWTAHAPDEALQECKRGTHFHWGFDTKMDATGA